MQLLKKIVPAAALLATLSCGPKTEQKPYPYIDRGFEYSQISLAGAFPYTDRYVAKLIGTDEANLKEPFIRAVNERRSVLAEDFDRATRNVDFNEMLSSNYNCDNPNMPKEELKYAICLPEAMDNLNDRKWLLKLKKNLEGYGTDDENSWSLERGSFYDGNFLIRPHFPSLPTHYGKHKHLESHALDNSSISLEKYSDGTIIYYAHINDNSPDGYSNHDGKPSSAAFYFPFESTGSWSNGMVSIYGTGLLIKGDHEKIEVPASRLTPSGIKEYVGYETEKLPASQRKAIEDYFKNMEEKMLRLDRAIDNALYLPDERKASIRK